MDRSSCGESDELQLLPEPRNNGFMVDGRDAIAAWDESTSRHYHEPNVS